MLYPNPSSAQDVQEGIQDQLTIPERLALAVPLSDEARARAVTILWTLKEGFVKATGEGIGWGLERISVDFSVNLNPSDDTHPTGSASSARSVSTPQITVKQVTVDGLDAADLGWYYRTGEVEGHGYAIWVKGEPNSREQLQMVEWDNFIQPLLALADELGAGRRPE